MIRYFCDVCSDPIADPETQIVAERGRIKVEIRRALDGTWHGGHVCRYCILRVVKAIGDPC